MFVIVIFWIQTKTWFEQQIEILLYHQLENDDLAKILKTCYAQRLTMNLEGLIYIFILQGFYCFALP